METTEGSAGSSAQTRRVTRSRPTLRERISSSNVVRTETIPVGVSICPTKTGKVPMSTSSSRPRRTSVSPSTSARHPMATAKGVGDTRDPLIDFGRSRAAESVTRISEFGGASLSDCMNRLRDAAQVGDPSNRPRLHEIGSLDIIAPAPPRSRTHGVGVNPSGSSARREHFSPRAMSPAGLLAWLGFAVQGGLAQIDEPSRRLGCRGEVGFVMASDVATTS